MKPEHKMTYLHAHGDKATDKRWKKIMVMEDEVFSATTQAERDLIEKWEIDERIERLMQQKPLDYYRGPEIYALMLNGPEANFVEKLGKMVESGKEKRRKVGRGFDYVTGDAPAGEWIKTVTSHDILDPLPTNILDMEPEEKAEVVAPTPAPAENVEAAEEKAENAEG